MGHYRGYRHRPTPDASTNIVPWGIIIGGEEEEIVLRCVAPEEAHRLLEIEPWLQRDEKMLREADRARLAEVLSRSRTLQTTYAMRRELMALWGVSRHRANSW